MSEAPSLIDLAERAVAEGPSREIDARIWCIVGIGSPWTAENCFLAATARPPEMENIGLTLEQWLDKWPDLTEASAENYNVPHFTVSLDSAMTLPMGGWYPSVILRQAIDACIMATGQDRAEFVRRLPAFVTAACLRAEAAQETTA